MVTNPELFTPIPNDWVVVLTDVEGSTKAIQAGRYRDVNIVGASSLIAVLNAVKEYSIPSVFGGDGGSILIPQAATTAVIEALKGARALARSQYGLDLRIGIVPVSKIRQLGSDILISKYTVGPTAELAAFSGGGLALADSLVKGSAEYQIQDDDDGDADFRGLQCRWSEFRSENGEMLNVIVAATSKTNAHKTYRKFLDHVDEILGHLHCPITTDALRSQINEKVFRPGHHEVKVVTFGKTIWNRFKYQAQVIFEMLAFKYMLAKGVRGAEFDPERYTTEVPNATDSRKFDDSLRLVLDCNAEQKSAIERYLEDILQSGEVIYGIHASHSAIMTCFIFDWKNHVHLVDGAEGGYAEAARSFKARKVESLTPRLRIAG